MGSRGSMAANQKNSMMKFLLDSFTNNAIDPVGSGDAPTLIHPFLSFIKIVLELLQSLVQLLQQLNVKKW